ncbi:MAG: HD domain-containing phosphohydrolase, partial [Bacillota bacterium]
PYRIGASDSLGTGHYCETVVAENKALYIKNALKNELWKNNPDVEWDMISYYGLPLNWSDGESFGTICILDDNIIDLDQNSKKLLTVFKNLIENDLKLLNKVQDLKIKNKAIETAIAGIVFINMQGEIFYANESFLKMSGHKKAEEIYDSKLTPFDLVPETEFMKVKNAIEITIAKGEWKGESKAIQKSGEEIDIKLSTSLVKDDNNQPLCMMASIEDITEKKRAEKKIKETKKSLENLSNQAPGVAHQYRLFPDGSFSFPYISEGVFEIYELTAAEVKKDAAKLFDRIHPADYDRVDKLIQKSVEDLSIMEAEYRVVLPEKGLRWVEAKAKPERLSDGSTLWYGNTHDITKRKKQEKKLKYQHKFTQTLAEISTDLLETNSINIDRKINHSLEKIGKFFEVDRSYIIQLSEDEFLSNTHEWCKKGIKSEKENFQQIPLYNFSWSLRKLYQNQHLNISDVDKMSENAEAEKETIKALGVKSLVIIPMYNENELFGFFIFDTVKNKRKFSDEEIRLLKIFTDTIINAFSKYINDKKIRELTYKDRLTGLYNRRFFEEELDRIDTKRQLPISIIVADINGLKIINDSLGHKKGDQLLKKAADILDESTREEDVLSRQGGDEFAILLPKTDKETAEKIIARIKKKTKQTNAKEMTVTIALGQAVKSDPDQKIGDVLKAADNDMYQNKLSESRSTKNRIVQSLLNTLEVKSNETKEHAVRMTKLALKFGENLSLSNSELNRLSLLSTLHDIGKITIAAEILKKPGSLNDEEWQRIKEHPERGYKIANSSEEFALVAEDIFAHHERWDGKGYPRKLKARDIPYLARIISIIDTFDVMTNDRPYTKAVSKKEALKEIEKCAGSQFDPELAAKFIQLLTD